MRAYLNLFQTFGLGSKLDALEAKSAISVFASYRRQSIACRSEDDSFRDPVRRDRSLPKKVETIRSKSKRLTALVGWEVEFSWAGTFGETKDGLAYIGPTQEYPRCFFLLGYGGNGITFSTNGANIITDMAPKESKFAAHHFRFGR